MTYFIRISDTAEVRRMTLESSKDLLHVLKGYHDILETRERKKETTDELRDTLAELRAIISRLEKLLPQQSLKEIQRFLPKRKKVELKKERAESPKTKKLPLAKPVERPAPEQVIEKPKPARPMSELERLERALANIEERLGQL
jgi:hypothetical protein